MTGERKVLPFPEIVKASNGKYINLNELSADNIVGAVKSNLNVYN